MKSRAFMIFFIAAIFILIAFPATSRAVTFPIEYKGELHAKVNIGTGSCEGDSSISIVLKPDGTIYAEFDMDLELHPNGANTCIVYKPDWGTRVSRDGTHDKNETFTLPINIQGADELTVSVTGRFDDSQITGNGSVTSLTGYITVTLTFEAYSCPTDKKIPLPVGQHVFADDAPASPVIGLVPSAIKPLGLGEIVNDKTSSSFRVQFCSFEGPVDIYLFYADASLQPYFLGSDGAVKDLENFQAWKTGVTGPVNETIASSFGGLFPDPGRLPKGTNTFYVAVAPSGNAPSGLYIWGLSVDTPCEQIHAGYPYGPNFFLHEPIAVPVYSSDPAKMKPLALGPVAVGGEAIAMYTDFCSFGGSVNLYFGLFCDDDLENLFLLNCSGKEDCKPATKNEILEKVPLSSFAGLSKPFTSSMPENLESQPQAFFLGSSQDAPKGQCVYFVAVTAEDEPQPTNKFYMWGTLVEFNIRNALIDFWWNNLHPAAGARTEAFQKNMTEKMTTLIQNKK